MSDLPAWLQEIRYRAEAATKGPWYRNGSYIPGRKSMVVRSPWTDKQRGDLHVAQCAEAKLSKGLIAKTSFGSVDRGRDPEWDNRDADAEFIAHARTDVPRLLELVGEMGEALRLAGGALDEACDVMHGGHHPGQLLDKAFYASVAVDSALAKYRGEVSSND